MSLIFFIASGLCMVFTVFTLGFGITTMARAPEFREKHANNLMKWRVMAQAGAVIFLFLAFAFAQNAGS